MLFRSQPGSRTPCLAIACFPNTNASDTNGMRAQTASHREDTRSPMPAFYFAVMSNLKATSNRTATGHGPMSTPSRGGTTSLHTHATWKLHVASVSSGEATCIDSALLISSALHEQQREQLLFAHSTSLSKHLILLFLFVLPLNIILINTLSRHIHAELRHLGECLRDVIDRTRLKSVSERRCRRLPSGVTAR